MEKVFISRIRMPVGLVDVERVFLCSYIFQERVEIENPAYKAGFSIG